MRIDECHWGIWPSLGYLLAAMFDQTFIFSLLVKLGDLLRHEVRKPRLEST